MMHDNWGERERAPTLLMFFFALNQTTFFWKYNTIQYSTIYATKQQAKGCGKFFGKILIFNNWGERERAPTLLMSMEMRPRPTATLRMREIRIPHISKINVYVIYVVFLTRDHNIS